jgi:hypothetical protein
MSQIQGKIEIDFDTNKPITKEQFKLFTKKLRKLIDNLDTDMFDASCECGFEVKSIDSVLLNDLVCDYK